MRPQITHPIILSLIGSLLCLLSHSALYAASGPKNQENPAPLDLDLIQEDLDFLKEETVSIAVRHEQPISEAPSNVYVITDEDIRHSGAIDLPTVLRRIPGIEVIQMTATDFNVSARGNNQQRANKMLVLVDGRSIFLDVQGEVLWKMIPITLPEIKQIEVLKGPASALYGFNAFDGIINIITKSPQEIKGATAQFGGGEFGTITSSAVVGGNFKRLGYRLSGGWDQGQRWDDRNRRSFRTQKFNGHLEYPLWQKSKLMMSGGLVDSNRYEGPRVDILTLEEKPSIKYANVAIENADFFIRGWWTGYDQPGTLVTNERIAPFFQSTDLSGSPDQDLEADSWNIEGQHSIEFEESSRLTYGVNYRRNKVESNLLRNEKGIEDRVGLYLQGEWKPQESLIIFAGVRFDMNTFINPTYSPRASVVYKPNKDHSIRAEFSMAYRPPTIFETRTNSQGSVFFLGCPPSCFAFATNPFVGSDNLKPERIISVDLGYQGWFFSTPHKTPT